MWLVVLLSDGTVLEAYHPHFLSSRLLSVGDLQFLKANFYNSLFKMFSSQDIVSM